MKRLPARCDHPEHAEPSANEDGWILTGLVDDSATWEAWMPDEWEMHCSHAEYERTRAEQKREAYRRKRAAALQPSGDRADRSGALSTLLAIAGSGRAFVTGTDTASWFERNPEWHRSE